VRLGSTDQKQMCALAAVLGPAEKGRAYPNRAKAGSSYPLYACGDLKRRSSGGHHRLPIVLYTLYTCMKNNEKEKKRQNLKIDQIVELAVD
jgi:hypothetical protein